MRFVAAGEGAGAHAVHFAVGGVHFAHDCAVSGVGQPLLGFFRLILRAVRTGLDHGAAAFLVFEDGLRVGFGGLAFVFQSLPRAVGFVGFFLLGRVLLFFQRGGFFLVGQAFFFGGFALFGLFFDFLFF